MAPIITVRDVWKRFRIPHERRTTILDHIAGAMSVLGGSRYNYEEFWALKQIAFTLERGESLGIIGSNGSGKSTLLKLIARTMKADEGEIMTAGSIAPVLELGIGFHGDLTAKENVQLYGVIMGLSRSEIKKRTDPVLDFAGLTRFQDARLKNFSSGMQVRLAFSIAIQTEADIFLVDEALSVGDKEFQEKCLAKFREFKNQGKTIILVSHNMDLVKSFCERTLYLQGGETKALGPSAETTQRYIDDLRASVHA
jgi:lipopolysaccharide transport system ATP-binding protein